MELQLLGLFGISMAMVFVISNLRRQKKREERLDREAELDKMEQSLTTMSCPQCAEDIKIQAKSCRYCGHDVSEIAKKLAAERAAKIAEHRVVAEREKQAGNRSVAMTFIILGVVALGVGVLTSFWPLTIIGFLFVALGLFALWGALIAARRAGNSN